jgi:antitoxin VapB
MGIFIRNSEAEALIRAAAEKRGMTITDTVKALAKADLATEAKPSKRKRTLAEMRAATAKFRRLSGLDKRDNHAPVTKAEWDALWPTGIPEIDNL